MARATGWGGRGRRLAAALGVDCLVLALVAPQAVGRPTTASGTLLAVVVTALILCYWAVDLLARRGVTGGAERAGRAYRAKFVLLLALVALVTVLPTVVAIGARRDSVPYRAVGDSAIEVEQDAAFLLRGTNYYARTFFDTPLARWWPVGPPNPALYHADKLPGEVVLAAALSVPLKALLGWFDVRLLYLLALRLARGPTEGLALAAALALNPLFVPSLISGDDDILVLAGVLGVVACARRGWLRPALVVLGLVCATKYTAVLLVPFVLCWAAGQRVALGLDRRATARLLLGDCALLALPVAVLIGPFLLWNAQAYLDSTIGFIAGTTAHSYPMLGPDGFGVATFVLASGAVRSAHDYFPFAPLQLAVTLPLFWVLLRRQWRDNTPERALAGYATIFLVASYMARFFPGRYVAYAAALCAVAYCIDGVRPAARPALRAPGWRLPSWGAPAHIGLDLLVLLLLVPQVLGRPQSRGEQLTAAAALLLVSLYAAIGAVGGRRAAAGRDRAGRLATVVLVLIVGLLVVWPSAYGIAARHHSRPSAYITDNAMQVEYATDFLLAGRNPYAVSYAATPMAQWYGSTSMTQALYHADELPFNFLLTVPARLLGGGLAGWFDERFLLLPLFCLVLVGVWFLGGAAEERRARLAAVALGPLVVPDAIYGDTDVIVVAALVAALVALRAERWRLAALAVGLALATKQTAMFLYPLYLAYLWGMAPAGPGWRERARQVWRRCWPSLLPPVLTVAPFLVWNAGAFWASTVGFVAGTVPHAYPIRGIGAYGFGAVVMLARLVPSPESYFPFAVLQIVVVAPLLVVLCRALAHAPSPRLLLGAYVVVMGIGYFFSRFLQDGGVGFILLVGALACLVPAARGAEPAAALDASGGAGQAGRAARAAAP